MGTYRCRVNDAPMTLVPGQGVVVKPGDRHEDLFDGPVRYFGLCFNLAEEPGAAPPPRIFRPGIAPELQRFAVELETFWPVVCSIQREAEHPDPVSGHLQDALVLTFFWRMIRALPRDAVNPLFLDVSSGQTFPAQVARLFQAHLDSDLSVADMAARLSLSESTFAHRCAELLGLPPRKAFLKCKMERAQYLLCYTAQPVKEIAALLGFADPFSFSRTFRKVCGVSPSDWRRRLAR
jgi:AraC-like DNA-binding protein